MADETQETRSGNALQKRAEQLKRWKESETNKEPIILKNKNRKINFSQGCVFLAACASGDKEEVKRLLENGADINTANVDGLTALHQACIDDNLDMVEFLIESGADLDRGDNEGWTPLHATASCGFVEIAKFLIQSDANVAAVNNDGDLPLDIAESDEMEELLQSEIDRQGIDAEVARNEEEQLMLADANQWLNNKIVKDKKHEKTGATALHVAAAKGYHKVMNLLIQSGFDLDSQDKDGWTPLHAASHWGQKEACEILSENFCNIEIKNYAGQTAFDVADPELVKFLDELKKKRATLIKKDKPELSNLIQRKQPPPLKRSEENKLLSSVTRMSVVDKCNINSQDVHKERAHLQSAIRNDRKDDKEKKVTSSESEGSSDSEVEKKNEANRAATLNSILATSQSQETSSEKLKEITTSSKAFNPPSSTAIRPSSISAAKEFFRQQTPSQPNPDDNGQPTSWRSGLRKIGSSSTVMEMNTRESMLPDRIPRSASSPRIPSTDQKEEEARRLARERRLNSSSALDDKDKSYKFANSHPYNRGPDNKIGISDNSTAASIPLPTFRRSRNDSSKESTIITTSSTTIPSTVAVTTTVPFPTTTFPLTTTTSSTTTTAPSTTTTTTFIRRSFVPPIRDDESETQRKLHAKRVRETRRSTQGVRAEDLQNAEIQLLKKQQEEDERRERESEMRNEQHGESDDSSRQRIPLRDSEDTKTEESSSRRSSNDQSESSSESSLPITPRIRPVTTPSTPETTVVTLPLRKISRTEDSINDSNKSPNRIISATETTVTLPSRKISRTEDENNDDNRSSARRRRVRSRLPTGIVYLDLDDKNSTDSTKNEDSIESNSTETENKSISDRYRSKYGTDSTDSARQSTRLQSEKPVTRSESAGSVSTEKDYKKLYEEQFLEIEKLKEKLKKSEQILEETKTQLERVLATRGSARESLTDADRREKRALERKLSEMEEELKLLEKLKAENAKLKEENRALTRVVSKLSK